MQRLSDKPTWDATFERDQKLLDLREEILFLTLLHCPPGATCLPWMQNALHLKNRGRWEIFGAAFMVIGLFTGAVGLIILQIKKRWYAADLNNLEFVSELLKKSMDTKEAEKDEQLA